MPYFYFSHEAMFSKVFGIGNNIEKKFSVDENTKIQCSQI